MTGPAAVQQLVRWIEGEIARTGRRYLVDWSKLDLAELREVQRLWRDLEHEKTMAVSRAQRMPWRRP